MQSYVDGYDIVAPSAAANNPMMDQHLSNNLLQNSGEYSYTNTHNEGGSMNVFNPGGGGQL